MGTKKVNVYPGDAIEKLSFVHSHNTFQGDNVKAS